MKLFLLVEDAPIIRKVANRILTDLGFIVLECEDGLEALNKCRNQIPDGIIVDWALPQMSGIEFITEFRRLENSGKTKILYCTSKIMVSEMARAKRAGATSFLLKPFNREILLHKIGEVGFNIEQASEVA